MRSSGKNLTRRAGSAPWTSEFYAVLFDALPIGVVILGKGRHVLLRNHGAQAMLALSDGFRMGGTGLSLDRPDEDARFGEILSSLSLETAGVKPCRAQYLAVSRRPPNRPYLMAIQSLGWSEVLQDQAPPFALVCIRDGVMNNESGAQVLCELWGFSGAEAGLAVALAERGSLKLAARMRGLTEGTARQYLKKICAKSGTKGQVELVSLLSTVLTL